MAAYYNDNDPFVCEWLRNLISEGLIADGDIDDRSIHEVEPEDVRKYEQAHYFAGIGGWSYALRLAGWPDDEPVWTGSCPCQPFSAAGKRLGTDDARHLWPEWHRLIAECRPPVVFGEQVASKAGRQWLAAVRAEMEALDYRVGAADLCAAGVGAPHIRQRLWFVADATSRRTGRDARTRGFERDGATGGGAPHIRQRLWFVADAESIGRREEPRPKRSEPDIPSEATSGVAQPGQQPAGWGLRRPGEGAAANSKRPPDEPERSSTPGGMANPQSAATRTRNDLCKGQSHTRQGCGLGDATGEQVGRGRQSRENFWRSCDWLPCTDGKARPIEPGTHPLAHGVPQRVGRLRGYGNSIVPRIAAEFIKAYQEVLRGED